MKHDYAENEYNVYEDKRPDFKLTLDHETAKEIYERLMNHFDDYSDNVVCEQLLCQIEEYLYPHDFT